MPVSPVRCVFSCFILGFSSSFYGLHRQQDLFFLIPPLCCFFLFSPSLSFRLHPKLLSSPACFSFFLTSGPAASMQSSDCRTSHPFVFLLALFTLAYNFSCPLSILGFKALSFLLVPVGKLRWTLIYFAPVVSFFASGALFFSYFFLGHSVEGRHRNFGKRLLRTRFPLHALGAPFPLF